MQSEGKIELWTNNVLRVYDFHKKYCADSPTRYQLIKSDINDAQSHTISKQFVRIYLIKMLRRLQKLLKHSKFQKLYLNIYRIF